MRLLPLLLLASASPAVSAPDLQHYTVRADEDLAGYDVHACFPGPVPEKLVAGSWRAPAVARRMRARIDGEERALAPRGRTLWLPEVPDDGCVDWRIEFDTLPADADWGTGGRVGSAVAVSPRLLLWRQEKPYADGDIEVRFELPEGARVSAPWRPVASRDGAPTFRIGPTEPNWPATLLIGRFASAEVAVPGATLSLALADAPATMDVARARTWLERGARAVTEVLGRFPVPRVQVLAMPVRDAHEAVPDAVTSRGGGAAIHVKLHAQASDAALARDWVVVHELAHFLLPFVDRRDAWLPEGLASYYQHVLRARSGALTAPEAWRALAAGLARGDRATRDDLTLRDATLAPGRNTMRIYWSGAALFLHADVELRRASGGAQSLDTVLAAFNACCREPDRRWRAEELLAKLDELSGTTLFSAWRAAHLHSRFFPNLRPLYAELGLEGEGRRVRLVAAPLAGLRDAITAPKAP